MVVKKEVTYQTIATASLARSFMVLPRISILRNNKSDDYVTCSHADSTDGKNGFAT